MFTARSAFTANANVTPALIWAHKSTVPSAVCNINQHTKVQFCQRFSTKINTQKYSSVSAFQQKSAHKSTVLSALYNRNQYTKVQFCQRFSTEISTLNCTLTCPLLSYLGNSDCPSVCLFCGSLVIIWGSQIRRNFSSHAEVSTVIRQKVNSRTLCQTTAWTLRGINRSSAVVTNTGHYFHFLSPETRRFALPNELASFVYN
jgi:hypothetical protein